MWRGKSVGRSPPQTFATTLTGRRGPAAARGATRPLATDPAMKRPNQPPPPPLLTCLAFAVIAGAAAGAAAQERASFQSPRLFRLAGTEQWTVNFEPVLVVKLEPLDG